MSEIGASRHDPVPIGEVAAPPFAKLPDLATLFSTRAQRFAAYAQAGELAPFQRFLAGVCDAQHRVLDGLPAPELPAADARARAREFSMPPLDRSRFTADPTFEATLDRLLVLMQDVDMPANASAALARVIAADPPARDAMVQALLADSAPIEALAEHLFVAAALQVHFARLAASLDAKSLVPVADGACPACGGPPVTSMVVGWHGAHGTRFCACSLCATMWNVVRIKCVLCSSTKGISYREVDGGPGTVKAEVCEECRGYVKILYQVKDAALEPVADDVGTLGLDLLVRDLGYRRGSFNPFLLGY